MEQDQANRIESKVDELLTRIGAAGITPPVPTHAGPGLAVVGGVALDLAEPLATDWMPSDTLREFARLERICHEPSNAPAGYPRRSPRGWPLFYAGVSWNGMGTPVGPPRVQFGNSTFADDAEVETWQRAAAARDANNARAGGTFGSYRPGSADS